MADDSTGRKAGRLGKVTSLDVARRAGVSQPTVSMVLSGAGVRARLSADTIERVRAAAAELDYMPNHAARSLRQRRTGIVTMILAGLDNPYIAEVVGGAQHAALGRGYSLHLVVAPDEASALAALGSLRSGVSDGVVITARSQPIIDEAQRLWDRGFAAALLMHRGAPLPIPSVTADLDLGGFLATDHLLRLGHRRIAHIIDQAPAAEHAADRTQGYRRALAAAGIAPDPDWIVAAENSFAGGAAAMQQLLAGPRPTAVFAYNDLMAVGVLHALRTSGRRVPDDVAVVGFDGIQLGAYAAPTLTTIDHPRDALGRLAVEMVIDRAEGTEPARLEHVLPVRLVVRQSCGAQIAATPGRKL